MESPKSFTSGYERRKSRKRSQILAAAMELFKKKGFSHVSVAQIAEQAGVSKVTIYNHFGDKYNLVEAAITELAEEKAEEYRKSLTSGAPWIERFRTVILNKKKTLRAFGGEFLETLYREYPDQVKRIREVQLRTRAGITYPFLDEGRRLGHVPENVSNKAVAAYLQVLMRGFDESTDILHAAVEEPDLIEQIFDLIMFGLVWNRIDSSESGA